MVWLSQTDTLPQGLYWLDDCVGPTAVSTSPPACQHDKAVPVPKLEQLPPQVAPILFQPIPINRADRDTIMIIPGIGPQLAGAILSYRDRVGRIDSKEALLEVEGVGAKKAGLIEGYVSFDD